MQRSQFNHVVVGSNGTGKTTYVFQIAIDYLRSNPGKRVLFVIPDDGEEKLNNVKEITADEIRNFTGVAKFMPDAEKVFDKFLEMFSDKYYKFDGLIICDDLGGVLRRRSEPVLRLFRRRRQSNLDFMWTFHGFRCEVPPSFYTYVNYLVMFRTSDNHLKTKDELPFEVQDEFERMYSEVQERSKAQFNYHDILVINPLKIYQ